MDVVLSANVLRYLSAKNFHSNGDGYNDYWNVKGVNASFNTNSIIFIYDRYGKLITKINTNSDGWDGTFNGNPCLLMIIGTLQNYKTAEKLRDTSA
jgi:gliding motility-associated-like protein